MGSISIQPRVVLIRVKFSADVWMALAALKLLGAQMVHKVFTAGRSFFGPDPVQLVQQHLTQDEALSG